MSQPGNEVAKEGLRKLLSGVGKPQTNNATEDLNQLPLPMTQEVCDKWVQWLWKPCDYVNIYGILYTATIRKETQQGEITVNKGDYEVQFSHNIDGTFENEVILTYNAQEAKAIGKAMLSASNWINVWKDHAGMFMERELLGERDV